MDDKINKNKNVPILNKKNRNVKSLEWSKLMEFEELIIHKLLQNLSGLDNVEKTSQKFGITDVQVNNILSQIKGSTKLRNEITSEVRRIISNNRIIVKNGDKIINSSVVDRNSKVSIHKQKQREKSSEIRKHKQEKLSKNKTMMLHRKSKLRQKMELKKGTKVPSSVKGKINPRKIKGRK